MVGGVLCCVIAAGEPYGLGVVRGSPMCADYSTGGALFLLFVVTVMNLLFRRCLPRLAFSRQELAIVYLMMVVTCAIPSWGFVMNLIAMISGITYFANPTNQWSTLLHPHLKKWLIVTDSNAVRMFFEGLKHNQPVPWGAWILPLAWWFSFAIVFFLVQVCVVVLFRRQWIENERLQFPLTHLPLEMITSDSANAAPLFASPWMWVGFAVPMLVNSINALHATTPWLPQVRLGWWFPIMRNNTSLPVQIRFEVLGLSYLLSSDVALSLWLFPLLRTFEVGAYRLLAWNAEPAEIYSDPGSPPVAYQGLGAMIALVILVVYRSRHHIKAAIMRHTSSELLDASEVGQLRLAFWGGLAGSAFLVGWLWQSGLSISVACVTVLFTFVIFTGLTRVVSQAGMAYGRPPVTVPAATMASLGTHVVGDKGLTALGLTFAWGGDVRTSVMASSANGLKLADAAGARGASVFTGIALACVISLVATTWSFLTIAYHKGAVTLGGWFTNGLTQANLGWVTNAINLRPGIRFDRFGFMAVGGAMYLVLSVLRDRFFWFPIHPIGLALGLAGPFQWNFFSIFLAWTTKVIVLRYFGAKGYSLTRPFFLGLILGNFVSAGVWLIITTLTGRPGMSFTGG